MPLYVGSIIVSATERQPGIYVSLGTAPGDIRWYAAERRAPSRITDRQEDNTTPWQNHSIVRNQSRPSSTCEPDRRATILRRAPPSQ